MPRKKNPNNQYFSKEVEDAIIQLNLTTDIKERDKIFRIIHPALFKISEVYYNKIKPTYVRTPKEDCIQDCITYLYERLPLIKSDKGKAFSYMTVTAKNYYLLLNMNAYKEYKRLSYVGIVNDKHDKIDESYERLEKKKENSNLYWEFLKFAETNFDIVFNSKQQKMFGTNILDKLKNIDDFEIINRRDIFNKIAEETGIERHRVTVFANNLIGFYNEFKEKYIPTQINPRIVQKSFLDDLDKSYISKWYKPHDRNYGINAMAKRLNIAPRIIKNFVRTL